MDLQKMIWYGGKRSPNPIGAYHSLKLLLPSLIHTTFKESRTQVQLSFSRHCINATFLLCNRYKARNCQTSSPGLFLILSLTVALAANDAQEGQNDHRADGHDDPRHGVGLLRGLLGGLRGGCAGNERQAEQKGGEQRAEFFHHA